jgi:hypothetical protein
MTPEIWEAVEEKANELAAKLSVPVQSGQAYATIDRLDGFKKSRPTTRICRCDARGRSPLRSELSRHDVSGLRLPSADFPFCSRGRCVAERCPMLVSA